jgi:hypothetical protein
MTNDFAKAGMTNDFAKAGMTNQFALAGVTNALKTYSEGVTNSTGSAVFGEVRTTNLFATNLTIQTLTVTTQNVGYINLTNPLNSTSVSNATASKLAIFGADKLLTNSAYTDTDMALAGSTNSFAKLTAVAELTNTVNTVSNRVTSLEGMTNQFAKAGMTNQFALAGVTNGVFALVGVTNSFALAGWTNAWGQVASTTNVVGVSNWVNAVSNLVQAKVVASATGTNLIAAASQQVDLSQDSTICLTNTPTTTTLWLTNCLDRKYFVFTAATTNGASTITITNACVYTMKCIATNGFSVITLPQFQIPANKSGTIVARVWVMAGVTNIHIFGNVEP